MCRLGCITLILHLTCCYAYYCNPLICKLNMCSPKTSICWPNKSVRPAGKGLIKLHMYSAPREMPYASLIASVCAQIQALWVTAVPSTSYHILSICIAKAMVNALWNAGVVVAGPGKEMVKWGNVLFSSYTGEDTPCVWIQGDWKRGSFAEWRCVTLMCNLDSLCN